MNEKIWKCENCGHIVSIGEWPFCPHGTPNGMMTFKPYFDEHISEKGEWITSWAQRRRLMKINNMAYRGVKRGMPRQEI